MKYLGIDWGMKKLGFAISEGSLAEPLTTVPVQSLEQALAAVRRIAEQEKADQILVGMPEGEMGQAILKATTKLREEGLPLFLVDETLSTQQAQQVLREVGASQKDRGQDDAMSAAIILQSYLDEKP